MSERKDGRITVRVGKNGLTPKIKEEIRMLLEKHKTMDVRLLRSFVEKNDRRQVKDMIRDVACARFAQIRGHVITLKK